MTRHQDTRFATIAAFVSLFGVLIAGPAAQALELDWSGQFRAEYNFIHNYGADNTEQGNNFDANRDPSTTGGYYIPSGGSKDATFQTLFLKLRPKIIVNDNIYIKSEVWMGDPVYGIFGNGVPYTTDQRQFYSNQNRGSTVTAQRFWGEFMSDIGTVQVGRAPLHWGLGIVWNNGDGFWDRYQSTGDTIRILSKFGAFSLMPSFILYSAGNNVGGAFPINNAATPGARSNSTFGNGGVREYSLALKYENIDDELEGGLNFIHRFAGAAQDASGYLGPFGSPVSLNFNIWDIYAKKRLGAFTLAAEVPITNGSIGNPSGQGMDYSTFAAAVEVDWKASETWQFNLKGGHAPGTPNWSGVAPTDYKTFYFNPAYRLGLIMFNYQLANFAGPNTVNNPAAATALRSPYDNPVVNANYLMFNPSFHMDKWTISSKLLYAQAVQTAANGSNFENTREHTTATAIADQEASLGFEVDLGATFQWDEYFQFRFDAGVWLPGGFYKFSNAPTGENLTSPVYAISTGVGVTF